MRAIQNINAEKVRDIFSYDEDIGILSWKKCKAKRVKFGDRAGSINHDGYLRISVGRRHYMAHRLAWLYVYGEWPNGEIDHINGVPSDNRISNLREVNHKENSLNTKLFKSSTSGVSGVIWNKINSNWRARISTDQGNRQELGSYKDFFEACCVRKSAERKHGYHPNHGRDWKTERDLTITECRER